MFAMASVDFRKEDDQPGGPAVWILSEGLWRRRSDGAAQIVGQTVRLDEKACTVIWSGLPPPKGTAHDRSVSEFSLRLLTTSPKPRAEEGFSMNSLAPNSMRHAIPDTTPGCPGAAPLTASAVGLAKTLLKHAIGERHVIVRRQQHHISRKPLQHVFEPLPFRPKRLGDFLTFLAFPHRFRSALPFNGDASFGPGFRRLSHGAAHGLGHGRSIQEIILRPNGLRGLGAVSSLQKPEHETLHGVTQFVSQFVTRKVSSWAADIR
jgi:hypothetical protein